MKAKFAPAWVECNLPWVSYPGKGERKPSFNSEGLNKSGTLIEVEENGSLRLYLIGDINELGGTCDDCAAFTNDTIVKRYKVLLEHE